MYIIRAPYAKYNEIKQDSETKFSFLDEKEDHFVELFYPVKCRDFLGDCIFSKHTGVYVTIYGFKTTPKLNLDKTKLLITSENEEEISNIRKNLSYLLKIEAKNKLEPTIIVDLEPTEDTTPKIVLIGDSKWMTNVTTISLYSYLIRRLSYKDPKPNKIKKGNEKQYEDCLGKNYKTLLNNISKIAIPVINTTGWNETNISCAHNSSGFVSLFTSLKLDNTLSTLFFSTITKNEPV
jgi:hypothetical protein